MMRIVPLNNEVHRSITVDGRTSAAYGDNQRFVQVIVKEFPLLVIHYPILFSKNAQTSRWRSTTLLANKKNSQLLEATEGLARVRAPAVS
jgi:hypothetical protein